LAAIANDRNLSEKYNLQGQWKWQWIVSLSLSSVDFISTLWTKVQLTQQMPQMPPHSRTCPWTQWKRSCSLKSGHTSAASLTRYSMSLLSQNALCIYLSTRTPILQDWGPCHWFLLSLY
jgi:hypothetical protein